MPTIADIKKDIRQMSTQDLLYFLKTIRDSRKEVKEVSPSKTVKRTKETNIDKLIKSMTPSELEAFIKELGETIDA